MYFCMWQLLRKMLFINYLIWNVTILCDRYHKTEKEEETEVKILFKVI